MSHLSPKDEQDPLIGARLDDKYELQARLGEGGMGTVYEARHLTLGHQVAVKVVKDSASSSDDGKRRFIREARMVAIVEAPNVIRIIDLGRHGGLLYYVMELVRGKDLARVVEDRGPLPAAEAVAITLQVARGLHAAHRHGVIHRDVKPHNILLAEDGTVKLADLGLAKPLNQLRGDDCGVRTGYGALMGSLGYMPREQLKNAADVDQRADVFALGATLYHLLTGHAPFVGASAYEIMTKVLSDQLEPIPEHIDLALNSILAKALRPSPAQRYQDCGEFITALEHRGSGAAAPLGHSPPTGATPPNEGSAPSADSAPTEPPKAPVRRRWLLAPAGVALLGGVAYGAWPGSPLLPTGKAPTTPSSPTSGAASVQPAVPAVSREPGDPFESLPLADEAKNTLRLAYSTDPGGAPPTASVAFLVQGSRPDRSFRLLRAGEALSSRNRYRVLMRPEETAYAYVFQIDTRGKLDVLFPRVPGAKFSQGENPIERGSWTSVPRTDAPGYFLDEHLGVEHLYAVLASRPWSELERALERAAAQPAPRDVRAAFGLRTRGVGGIGKAPAPPLPGASLDVTDRVELLMTGTHGVLAREIWFEHVAPPGP